MSYSRRQLYALGEPLGDCVTRKTGGRIIYGDGGGGGGGQPSQTTQTTDLPEWARGYAKDTLAKGAALTDISKNPYQAYKGERIAGFQPLQEQAFKSAATLDAGPAGFQAGIGQYMSPYMQNVVDIEKREAARQSGILGTQQQAQATQAGAFGGGRDAIMRAERERNLSQQMGDIQAKGSQAAYEQAANQFRQGIQQQGALTQLQTALGQQQQQQAQRPLDVAYQDFLNQQNYPYKQLGYMSDMIRGLPLGQRSTSQVYEAPGSVLGQLGGLGMGAYGLSKIFAEGGLAGGSMIDENEPVIRYADGGITSQQNVENILSKLSDRQLQQAKEAALNRRDAEQAQMIDAEIAHRAAVRAQEPIGGIASGISNEFADGMEQAMATGGIVAFADGDVVSDPMGTGAAEIQESATAPYGRSFLQWLTNEPEWKAKLDAEKAAKTEPKKEAPAPKAQPAVINLPPKEAPVAEKKTAPARGLSEIAVKPPKADVKSAVAQFAEQNNLSSSEKEDVMTNALKIREELGKPDQPILDKLSAMIESQKPDEQAMKDKGFAQALAEYGFGVAARASRPGARALESFAGEAPTLAKVAAKTDELINARKDNYAKLQMDQAKYEVALAKSNMQTAAALAGQIRQGQQQDKMLQFHIAKAQDDLNLEKQKLAQQGAYQQATLSKYETVGGLTRDIMQNEGLPYDKALEKAARMLKPAGYAADVRAATAQNANLDKALKDIDAKQKYAILAFMKPDNPKYASLKAEYEAERRAAYARHGGAEEASGSPSPSLAQKGFKLLGTE